MQNGQIFLHSQIRMAFANLILRFTAETGGGRRSFTLCSQVCINEIEKIGNSWIFLQPEKKTHHFSLMNYTCTMFKSRGKTLQIHNMQRVLCHDWTCEYGEGSQFEKEASIIFQMIPPNKSEEVEEDGDQILLLCQQQIKRSTRPIFYQ